MSKKLTLALFAASLALVARPSEARAPVVTITHETGYGFFANWGPLEPQHCDGTHVSDIYASLNYTEQFNTAALNLGFFNSCTGHIPVNLNAGGSTDPRNISFPFNYNQHVAIDKTLGGDGLIAWATYSASIPIQDFGSFPTCWLVAKVNVRLDQK